MGGREQATSENIVSVADCHVPQASASVVSGSTVTNSALNKALVLIEGLK